MAPEAVSWSVSVGGREWARARSALFPADGSEGAVFLACGEAHVGSRRRLLTRYVLPVRSHDWGPSDRGAEGQIAARAVATAARRIADDGLALVWAHSHPRATNGVRFSQPDQATIARAYPTLLEITNSRPVGALVVGQNSAAGQIWTREGIHELEQLRIVGPALQDLRAAPLPDEPVEGRHARQALLLGEAGQARLRRLSIGVLGGGGGGSLITQQLAHLGVGRIVVVDFDRVEGSNLSRIVGSEAADEAGRPRKIDVLKRLVRRIDPSIDFVGIDGDITYAATLRQLTDLDFAFLATDRFLPRLAFNVLVQQYLVPGIQVGAKVTRRQGGTIELMHVAERPVLPGQSCLECGGLIDPNGLRDELATQEERRAQGYIDGPREEGLEDPSVITFNSVAGSLAMTDFLLMTTGLHVPGVDRDARVYLPETRALHSRALRSRRGCQRCDGRRPASAFAMGDGVGLPLRPGAREIRP